MKRKNINIQIEDITDKIAQNYLKKKSIQYANFTKKENVAILKSVKSIKINTLMLAALYGALGVALLYIPQYIFSESFSKTQYSIPVINYKFKLSIFEMLYGFFLVGIEIWL